MLNKDKVNEIVADMQKEERLRKEELERQADEFLKDRLEYYVAMVVNDKIIYAEKLIDTIENDKVSYSIKEIVLNKIESSLEELDIFRAKYCYAHISDIKSIKNDWFSNEKIDRIRARQKELGIEIAKEEEDPWFDAKRTIQKMHDDNDLKEKMETYKLISGILLAFLILALVFIFLLCTHQNIH
jgi:hypothetical protein